MKDLAEILKNAPRGLKLYTPVLGEVEFMKVNSRNEIVVFGEKGTRIESFDSFGRKSGDGECLLFPEKGYATWDRWQEKLFRNGDFITIGWDTRLITDLENRVCVTRTGHKETLNILNMTRWATGSEVSGFMKSLELNGFSLDTETLEVKEKSPDTGSGTSDFEKTFKDNIEYYHKMRSAGTGEERLSKWVDCWTQTLLEIARRMYTKPDCTPESETGCRPETGSPEPDTVVWNSENQCITVDNGFLKPDERLMWKKSEEIARLIVENPCDLGEEKVSNALMDMSNLTRNCVLAELEDFLTNRIEELKEIKSREEGHGITSTDMMSVTGGMQEIQILLEKLRNSK